MEKTQFKQFEGFLITKNKISILAEGKALTKKGSFLSSDQQISYFKAFQNYLDSVQKRTSSYDADNIKIREYNKPVDTNEVFYKYVSKNALEKFIKNGIFKLGTLNHYQKAKNNKIKDIKEGYTHLILESKEKQLLQSYCAGYNYLIFCGSHIPPTDTRSEYLKKKFGPCVLKIQNTNSFRREILKHLNLKSSLSNRVEYNEMKILKYLVDNSFTDTSPDIIDNKTFSLINNIICPNTIFKKTIEFSPEYELRFAFETKKDQKRPVIIHNKGLLDYVEIINE